MRIKFGDIRVKAIVLFSILAAFGAFYFAFNHKIKNPVKTALSQYDQELVYISGIRGYQSNGLISIASTDEPAVNIGSYNIQAGRGKASLYESNLDNLMNFLLHDDKNDQINQANTSSLRLVQDIDVQINPSDRTKVSLPLSESGIWYLTFTKDNKTTGVYIVRSRTGTVLKEADDEYLVWAQNYSTGKSVTQGSVKLFNLENRITQLAESLFDNQGIAKLRLDPKADVAISQIGSDISVVPVNLYYLNSDYTYTRFQNKVTTSRYFLFTDRPIYKPGDTINFKAILREDDDARYSIPNGQAEVTISRPYDTDNPVFERNLNISNEGTIAGSYTLPETMGTGDYHINVSLPGQQQEFVWGSYGDYAFFKVDYYRKPEYGLEITTPQNEYVMKDLIKANVSGQYFFGQPITNSTVKYKVSRAQFWDYDYWYSEYTNYLNDDYRYGLWYGTEVKSGEIKLNERGLGEIEIPTDWGSETQVVSIEAEYTDESGNPSFARKNVLVYSGEFGLYRTEGSYSGKAGSEFQLPLILVSHREANKNFNNVRMEVVITRDQWIPNYDSSYFSYRQEHEVLPSQFVTTDSSGKANFIFTPQKPGSYNFNVQVTDSRGNKLSKNFYSWIVDYDDTFYGENNADLSLRSDRQQYLPGSEAGITVTSTMADRDALITMERASVLRYQVISFNGKSAKLKIPLVSADMPNIFVTATSFTNTQLVFGQTNVTVSAEDKKIVMELIPDKKTLAPGETVKLTVKTSTPKGLPVSADTAVWAVDKALFELVENPLGDIHRAFWSERYNQTETANSLQGIGRYTAEHGGCFAQGTMVLMADGTSKKIEDVKAGDEVLTFASDKNYELVSAKVISTHSLDEDGYLVINSNLKVTPNHKMFIDGSWQVAGNVQVGSQLLDSKGRSVFVTSVEWQKGKTRVYNLSVENYQTFFADGVFVHNQKGGEGGAARTVFKDTAYWNPSVRTNSLGTATVSFKLPDNLTTWAIAGVAATSDTKVGQGTSELVVTKNLIVRPILPNIMRIGDEMNISAMVYNYSGSNQNMKISFDFDSGDIVSGKEANQLINDKDFAQLTWKVRPTKTNEKAKLTFAAVSTQNSTLQDRIVQEIPVKPFGFVQKQVYVGENDKAFDVSIASDTNRDQSKVVLSLSPTLLGTLPTAMKYLVDYPYGCIEQTTSRFVPAVIAKSNPQIFASALEGKDANDMIKTGIVRLTSLQQDDGGWSWWYEGGSDPFITAYVVDYTVRARALGAEIDNQMLTRAQRYLESTYDQRTRQDFTDADWVAKTFALSRLNAPKGKTLLTNFDGLSADVLSLAVLSNVKNGNTNPQTNGAARLILMAKTEGEGAYWDAGKSEAFGSIDASTGLALRALVAANQKDTAIKAVRYLTRHRERDFWSNSFATAQVIQGIVDYTAVNKEFTPSFNYTISIDTRQIASGAVASGQQTIDDILIPLSDITGRNQIRISKSGAGSLYSTMAVVQLRTDKKAAEADNGFSVRREFESADGPQYSIGVGDVVNVKLIVTGNNDSNYAVISDELPSGLVPINQSLRNQQYDPYYWGTPYDYYYSYYYGFGINDREQTLNGMDLSAYRISKGEQIYTYKARAVAAGTFETPPARAELMYSPQVNGTSGVQTVTIDSESQVIPAQAAKAVVGNEIFLIIILILILGLGFALYKGKISNPFAKKEDNPDDPTKKDSNNDSSGSDSSSS